MLLRRRGVVLSKPFGNAARDGQHVDVEAFVLVILIGYIAGKTDHLANLKWR